MFAAMQTVGSAMAAYQLTLAITAGACWILLRLGLVRGLYPESGRHREGEPVAVVLTRCLAPGNEEPPVRPARGARAYRRLPTSRLAAAEASVDRRARQMRARAVQFIDTLEETSA